MRHRNSGRKLSRTPAHRKALFRNMAKALLTYGRITTTEAKAKEIRGVVEPLITLGQQDTLNARRQAFRMLGCHKLVKRLFDDIAPAYAGIPGGFTRIAKLALPRKGDAAPMAVIELSKELPAMAADADAVKKAAKPKTAKPKDGAESKAPKAVKPKAVRSVAPKAPKGAPKSSAPKKMKIGGE